MDLIVRSLSNSKFKLKLEELVNKATKDKPVASNPKHEKMILGETWISRSSSDVFAELFTKRPLEKEVVVWKTLILVHKLQRDGHPSCLEECYHRMDIFEAIKNQYQGSQNIWGILSLCYLEYLSLKISFHKEYPTFTGNFNLAKLKENIQKIDTNNLKPLINTLWELQNLLLKFQEKVLTMQGLDLRLAAIVPCLWESHSIFNVMEYLLHVVQDTTDLDVDPLVDNLMNQLRSIENVTLQASLIPYLRLQKPPPLVPPNFKPYKPKKTETVKKNKTKKDKSSDSVPKSQSSPVLPPDVSYSYSTQLFSISENPFQSTFPSTQQTLPNLPNPFHSTPQFNPQLLSSLSNPYHSTTHQSTQSQHLTSQSNPFQSQSQQYHNPMQSNILQQTSSPSLLNPSQQNFTQMSQSSYLAQTSKPFQPENQQKDDFSDLFHLGKQLQSATLSSKSQPAKDEIDPSLIKQIALLENKIKEIEQEIKQIDTQNSELRKILSEQNSGLSAIKFQMEEQMKLQEKLFLEANQKMKSHIENTRDKYIKDKSALMTDIIQSDCRFVEQMLLKFENPNNLGNRGVTSQDILQGTKSLRSNYDEIVKVLETGAAFGGVTRNLVNTTSKILDDVKGALTKIKDPNLKQQIATSTQNIIKDISQLLIKSCTIVAQPQGKADPRQLEIIKDEQRMFSQHLQYLDNAVMNAQSILCGDPIAKNLESVVEQELLSAVKILTEMANALHEYNSNQVTQTDNSLDLGKIIRNASESILQSLSLLVSLVATAQSDQLKQELTGITLNSDPMWTEILVKSSRGIINGAQELMTAARNCTSTQLNGASLKEAAKTISISTSELVKAFRAKYTGQSRTNIDQSAQAVIKATNELVEAADTWANAEHIEILKNSINFVDIVKEEIENQAQILKIEKELNLARIRLNLLKQERANTFNFQSFNSL